MGIGMDLSNFIAVQCSSKAFEVRKPTYHIRIGQGPDRHQYQTLLFLSRLLGILFLKYRRPYTLSSFPWYFPESFEIQYSVSTFSKAVQEVQEFLEVTRQENCKGLLAKTPFASTVVVCTPGPRSPARAGTSLISARNSQGGNLFAMSYSSFLWVFPTSTLSPGHSLHLYGTVVATGESSDAMFLFQPFLQRNLPG